MTTNLSGSLSEFSLAEVLSLLGMGGRTARMQVTTSDSVGSVHLIDGQVAAATADSARAGLLRALVAALPVPADDLARAVHEAEPVRELVSSGALDRDAALQVAAEHCTEAVGEMLNWAEGEFAVWVGAEDPADIGVRLSIDDIVGAARKRAREWRDLRAALPEADSVLALVPDLDQPPAVDAADWAVLARVDGRRTLSEVLAAMGASPLASGGRLVRLMGRGLVVVSAADRDAEAERTDQLLHEFESGDPDCAVEITRAGAVDPEPDVAPVHVQEVESVVEFVDEPQLGPPGDPVPEQWTVAEANLVADGEPVPGEQLAAAPDWGRLAEEAAADQPAAPGMDELAPVGAVPPGYELPTPGFEPEPVRFEAQPMSEQSGPPEAIPASVPEPAPAGMAGTEPDAEPMVYAPEPNVAGAGPFGVDESVIPPAPELEPAAEAFAWSPWAQEMGLGEPALDTGVRRAASPAQGQDYADMMAEGQATGHTEAFPTPQAPTPAMAMGGVAVAADPQQAAVGTLPQPRQPGDVVAGEPSAAPPVGTHAWADEVQQDTAAGAPVPAAEPTGAAPQGDPADPLAGGLLAHLMSSVRGL